MNEILIANMDDIDIKSCILPVTEKPNTLNEQAAAYLDAYELETAKGE